MLLAAHRGQGHGHSWPWMRAPTAQELQAGKRHWVFSHPHYQHLPITACSSPGHFICPFPGQLPGLESLSSSSCGTKLSHYCRLNREQKCLSEVSLSPPAPSLLLTWFESLGAEHGWPLGKDSLCWQVLGKQMCFISHEMPLSLVWEQPWGTAAGAAPATAGLTNTDPDQTVITGRFAETGSK